MTLMQLKSNSFEEIIFDRGGVCLVIFLKKSCHVCKEVVPVLEELQPKYQSKIGFYFVDVEDDPSLQQRFSLKGVPQILYFNGGDFKGKQAGKVEEDQIEEKIVNVLES